MSFPMFFTNANFKYISMEPCDFILSSSKNETFIEEVLIEPKSTAELLKTFRTEWLNTAYKHNLGKRGGINSWRRVIIPD